MAIKLIYVEDDLLLQRMYDLAFADAGFDAKLAKDGTIVLETILINRPDVILMDVMMPNFDGIKTLREIKAHPVTSDIPVIMISACDDKELIDKAMSLGAERYILKGTLTPAEIIEIIEQAAAHKNQRLKS